MPSVVLPPTPHYPTPPPTTHDLDWADLAIIDFSHVHTPQGREQLAVQVQDALKTTGFFYVINHGYTPEQTSRIFDISNVIFEQVGLEEKKAYTANIKQTGSYHGYKPRAYWHVDGGVKDQIELYSLHRDVNRRSHPEPLRPFLPEIASFAQHCHYNVLHPILRLIARGLEIPEETLVGQHGFYTESETYTRLMKYYPRSEEDEQKSKNVWLKGHTDVGSITILWSQPVSALQILSPDGKWRWIKHIENALVINAGDCIEFLSGGFFKATIHRVVQPPPDQHHCTRLGLFYFCLPDDDVKLAPLLDSPVLQREGVVDRFDGGSVEPPTVDQWRKARVSAYGQSELKKGKKAGTEEEVIKGVLVKHYN